MRTTKYTLSLTLLILMITTASPAFAQSGVISTITYVENGWHGEGLAVGIPLSTVNPGFAGCTAISPELGQFFIPKTHPAYKELTAIALTAYTASTRVWIVAHDNQCQLGGRVKLFSIRLIR